MLESTFTDQQLRRMSESEVIRRAKGGCRSATEFLLRKYQSLVEAKARSYFLMGADREDVIQEGRIGLYKAIRDFSAHSLGGFRSFAAMCVTRQIISAVKGASRRKHAALNLYVSVDASVGDDEEEGALRDALPAERGLTPEAIVVGREMRMRVTDQMDRTLSKLERDVLAQYLRGGSYRDIALKLGTNIKQVDNALQRAKRKLEKQVSSSVPAD